jgi:CBS domain-containing protein
VLLGIISDRDIRRVCGLERIQDEAAQATGRFYLGRSTASEIMTTDLRTVTREATLLDVAHDITTYAIGCIPIVDGRKLAGLLTDTDIVRIVARLDS